MIATSGTTNTGAFDDLRAAATLCEREDLWFHFDGCIGVFLKLSESHAGLVEGLETANSVALDPHKWMHAPFEAGCVVIRDAQRHFDMFEMHGEYLQLQTRGMITGKFLADYGLELSRGFKAHKLWMSLREHGSRKFGQLIDQNIAQARHLKRRIEDEPELELVAPVPINIVCFRYRAPVADETSLKVLNTEIMARIQESGMAVLSDTMVGERHCLRVAINNHRTRNDDLDLLVAQVLRHGREIQSDV